MANFPTHIAVGTIVSGALATVTLAADVVAPENLVAVTLAGVLGSVLPDIDLKDSRPSRALFAGLGVFFAFAVLFSLDTKYSVAEMLILWLGTLLAVRYIARPFFHRMSYHRGIWHSILAGVFCSCLTAIIYTKLLGRHEGVAWLAAGFLFVGFMTHLILDEIYSVDVMDTRIKASFGTALKVFDAKHPGHSIAMLAAAMLAFWMAPSMQTFVTGMSSKPMWTELQHRLLPRDKWFGVDWRSTAWMPQLPFRPTVEAAPVGANSISTGSIRPAAPATQSEPLPSAATPQPK
jgi:hypothetical protein